MQQSKLHFGAVFTALTYFTTPTSGWFFNISPQTDASPINDNFPFAQDGHHPNVTKSFPFRPAGQNEDWTMRINITESMAPGVTTESISSFQRSTPQDPRILTTIFDLSWPGNKTFNETVVPTFSNSSQARFCLYNEGEPFSAKVTDAYKGGSSCDDAFGAACAKAIADQVDARAANQTAVLDGCPFDWFFDQLDECKGVFTGHGYAEVAAKSPFEYLNNTSTGAPGYPKNVTWEDRMSGDGFYYRFSEAYEAGNQTAMQTETNRLNMVIITTESTSLLCMRVNDTAQLNKGDPGTYSSAPGLRMQMGMWSVVALAVGFFAYA